MALDGICQRIDGIFRGMPSKSQIILDDTDCLIVAELQRDGRQSVAELGRVISMSASATADRVRRLTDHGVLTGYVATVSAEALGYDIAAFVRLAYPSGNYKPLHAVIDTTPEVIEAHHTTGDDCFVFKVVARNMRDLERITGKLATLGSITTSVVYSSTLPGRPIAPAR